MDADELRRYVCENFEGVRVDENAGDSFFSYAPDGELPADRWLPFATIVTSDNYDTVSNLSEPGAYRVNIGLTKAGYTSRFGSAPAPRHDGGVLETGFDYAARDTVLPHPSYASQYWVCVVCPERTVETVRSMLAEAYDFAARKHENRRRRESGIRPGT